jgi:26S proteasome regulatory subunit N1
MPPKDKEPVDVTVGSGGDDATKANKDGKKPVLVQEENLSEEDRELKERLETCVETTTAKDDASVGIRMKALEIMVTELRTATASMTSVPKPLKFLRPHYATLKAYYDDLEKTTDPSANDGIELRARLAEVMAVLAMTMSKPEDRESLQYKLKAVTDFKTLRANGVTTVEEATLGSWGHEFVRSLAGEIGQEYGDRVINGADPDADEAFADLMDMVKTIVPFHVSHNAEAEAIDLLIEVQRLKLLLELDSIDGTNYERICLYLIRAADYVADPDDLVVRYILLMIFHHSPVSLTYSYLFFFAVARKCSRRQWKFTRSKAAIGMPCGWCSA